MKTICRSISSLLAVAVVATCVSLSPVYAVETEISEPMTTTEVVPTEPDESATEVVPTEPDESAPEVVPTEPDESATEESAGNGTMDEGGTAPELYGAGSDIISSMDNLVAVLGASNVSVQSATGIKLVADVVYPASEQPYITFLSGTYVIDFNGHIIQGKIGFSIDGASLTLLDSSSAGSGGIVSQVISVNDTTFSSYYGLALNSGALTVLSGHYTAVETVILARTGNLNIEGGEFTCTGAGNFIADRVAVIYAGLDTATIKGGIFTGAMFALICYKDTAYNPADSIPNSLKISGGQFESFYKAIYYQDSETTVTPDMNDILADNCILVPSTLASGPTGAGGGMYVWTEATVQVFQTTGAEGFVYRLYNKVLERTPEYTGYTYWVASLKNHQITGSNAAYGFFFSQELTNRNLTNSDFITLMYNTFFDRAPDAGGMAYWMSALETGASRKYVFAGFANSLEWKSLCGTFSIDPGSYTSDEARDQNIQVTAFVKRLYTSCLNRQPDVTGLNSWTAMLNNHSSDGAHVAYGFFFSQEFTNRNLSNDAYVDVLYNVLLGRSADAGGKANWVAQLAGGKSRLEIFKGFVHSAEFTAICASYGITRGSI